MLIDSHCHPGDAVRFFPQIEEDRRRLKVITLASACNQEEFAYNEKLTKRAAAENASPILPCFAIHPQLLSLDLSCLSLLPYLDRLAFENRLAAIGECGFDLYNSVFRKTETQQDELFAAHLETALKYGLPVVLHVRRAIHKIFSYTKTLKSCKAVVFHSWAGTYDEGKSLLRRGINAYFSFGNTLFNGHKKAMQSCAGLPAERLLTETDAPYQPQRGRDFSYWTDIPDIIKTIAVMRNTNPQEIESQIESNFFKIGLSV